MSDNQRPPVYYSEYLQLDKILSAQAPESTKEGIVANDEMLFIVIHQTYELWFKQVLHELNLVRGIFKSQKIEDNTADLYDSVNKLKRICSILEILVQQISVLETMTALDFLDFRDLLRPASGFQSIQFKTLEALLGLQFQERHGKEYYTSQLCPRDVQHVKDKEADESLFSLVNKWLERMPFVTDASYWQGIEDDGSGTPIFLQAYKKVYDQSLQEGEKAQSAVFESLFINPSNYPEGRKLSQTASANALFIMLYRDFPRLQLPFQLLDTLLEIDGLMGLWRYRHIHMVRRTIGKRVGTGGSTGADYLRQAAESHYIFKEISELTSFLMARHELPKLPTSLQATLSYNI